MATHDDDKDKDKKRRYKLSDLDLNEVSLVDSGANQHAHITLIKRADDVGKQETKTVDGEEHPASDFAYVPDPESPSTWKLPIFDAQHASMAAAALGPGFRGQKVSIPAEHIGDVKARVRAAWRRFYPDRDEEDMPSGIKKNFVEVLKEEGNWTEVLEDFEDDLSKAHQSALLFNDILHSEEVQRELWKVTDAMMDSIRNIVSYGDEVMPPEEKRQKVMESLSQFNTKVVSMVAKAQSGGGADNEGDSNGGGSDMPDEEMQKQLDELKAQNEQLQKELDETKQKAEELEAAKAEAEKAKEEAEKKLEAEAGEGEGEGDGINKAELPEEVRKHLESLEEANKKNQAALEKMQDEAENREILAKVEKDYPNVAGVEQDELVKLIKAVRHNCPDHEETLAKALQGADEAAKQALYVEKGSEGVDHDDQSAVAQLEKKAADIAARDGITKEQAFAKAYDEYPDLAKRELRERQGEQAH